jgi:hypothetical protein
MAALEKNLSQTYWEYKIGYVNNKKYADTNHSSNQLVLGLVTYRRGPIFLRESTYCSKHYCLGQAH